MAPKIFPVTIGLIPDGNRRWANSHKLSILNGYSLGVKKFIEFSEWCMDYGINNLSVWAFSTENFRRSKEEINILFNTYKKVANDSEIINRLHNNKTRLNIIGNKSLLPKDLLVPLHKIELETKKYKEMAINMLIGYGGREDIMHAVRKIASGIKNKAQINEDLFKKYMLSSAIPDLDFVIRTSGEKRLSGFMPWQSEYSELYFSKKLWPDFTRKDLHVALLDYSDRQRRFGK